MNKILMVSDNFPPDVPGGISLVTYHLACSLPPSQVVVLAPAGPNSDAFDKSQPFRIDRVPFSTRSKLATVWSTVRLVWHGLRLAKREGCSLLYFSKPWPVGIMGLPGLILGLPYVVHTHGSDIYRKRGRLNDALCSLILRRATRVIANSSFTKSHTLRLGVAPERTVIIHPKVDPERFEQPFDASSFLAKEGLLGKRILLTVGRLVNPRKGVDRVIETLPLLIQDFPDLVYVVVGEGRDRERLESLADRHGVRDRVLFAGNRDAVSFFRVCDVFVMVSRTIDTDGDVESFGIVYLEANACRKPVVAGNTGGVADAVEDRVSGMLVDSNDVGAIAGAIGQLLSDDDLSRRLGEQGHARLMDRFTSARYKTEFGQIVAAVGHGQSQKCADEEP